MEINATTPVSRNDTSAAVAENTDILGKDDFLMLLVTQLENQDPLNPMEHTEFVAQLAQFSSLEQLQNVNDNVEGLQDSQVAMRNTQAVSYIGKTIKAEGSAIRVQEGTAEEILIDLDRDAASVFVNIYDSSGNYVSLIEAGALTGGEHVIQWDGRDYAGAAVPDGIYAVEIQAVDDQYNAVGSSSFTAAGVVTGVAYENGTAYLITDERMVPLQEVIEVSSDDGAGGDGDPQPSEAELDTLVGQVSEVVDTVKSP
jgi:flagellar basal-body rod modification protein FlgD